MYLSVTGYKKIPYYIVCHIIYYSDPIPNNIAHFIWHYILNMSQMKTQARHRGDGRALV